LYRKYLSGTGYDIVTWHLSKAFDRGAGRDHRVIIGLKRVICEVSQDTEDGFHTGIKKHPSFHSYFVSSSLIDVGVENRFT
jgi:hypothetical protein